MTRASRAAGAELYLDGTKNIRRAELFLEHSAPGSVPVLHMVRDPRGFAKSMLTEPTEQWRKPDARMAARRWMRYLEAIDRLRESHPAAPFLEVRYEDLCHDPAGTLESIQRFLDVDCVDLLRLPKTQHHILGNRIRHTFEGPVVEDRSWTRSLSAKQVFEIEACCRSRMWSLRYTTNA